jgi:cytochrome bd ubiquinol oxidase subunit I
METLLLSRIQLGLTMSFHIIFPALTMGLALLLVAIEFLWLRTRDELYYRMYRFWVKIFAIHFTVGVVTGIALAFQFGTNFAVFSQKVANIIAPMLAFESMTAFFLEAGFLGIMLFGWNRVPPALHFAATCLVALGASLSAFWIMAANAWIQTPAGYELVNGTFMLTSWWEAIFNPTFPTHLGHMVLASFLTAAFAVAGISAYYLLKDREVQFYRRSLALALVLAAVSAPLQIVMGDYKGLAVARYQPAKLAALEAHWDTNIDEGAAFTVFALPDMRNERNRFEITIPNLLSMIVTRSMEGQLLGLKEFPPDERPYVPATFFAFRIMVAIGFIFLGVMLWAGYLWWRKRLFDTPLFLKTLVIMQPLGFFATIVGWWVAEVGRQPWVVYGLMRTSDGVSPIAAGNVVWSLLLFVLFFGVIGVVYFYYTIKTLQIGPDYKTPIPPIHRMAGMQALTGGKEEEA